MPSARRTFEKGLSIAGGHLRREPRRWSSSFGVRVSRYGATSLARDLGVTTFTVYKWLSGRHSMHDDLKIQIEDLTARAAALHQIDVVITSNDIVDHYRRFGSRKRR